MNRSRRLMRLAVVCAVALSCWGAVNAQAPAAPAPAPPAPSPAAPASAGAAAVEAAASPLDQLAWLRGCWSGNVNRRAFDEQWLPARGGMMVGASHTTLQNRKEANAVRTEDFTYLRLEVRSDGVYYVAIPSGTKELSFKLTDVANDKGALIFTFSRPTEGFPQRIIYHRTEGGMLFAQVEGKIDGKDDKVIYPMQHVDCVTGRDARD